MPSPASETVIFGIHAVEELIKSRPNEVDRVYFDSGLRSSQLFNLLKECKKLKLHYQHVPSRRIEDLCGSTRHQGVAAQCSSKAYADIGQLMEAASRQATIPLFLVAASVEDPGNLGAVIRSAVGFGVTGLMMERKNTVPLNATVAKASAGMLEQLAIAKPNNLELTIDEFAQAGYAIIGAEGQAQKTPPQIDFRQSTVLIIGGEHRGIPPYLRKRCTDFVRIPIAASVESLNLSAATAVLLYEASRQRGFGVQ
jgi:23S rRNA (guanosine2251-2'-O)-methyltransferase